MRFIKAFFITSFVAILLTLLTGGIFNFMLYIKEWTFSFPTFIGFTIFISPLILYTISIIYFIIWLTEEKK
jgi:hypothetical protein